MTDEHGSVDSVTSLPFSCYSHAKNRRKNREKRSDPGRNSLIQLPLMTHETKIHYSHRGPGHGLFQTQWWSGKTKGWKRRVMRLSVSLTTQSFLFFPQGHSNESYNCALLRFCSSNHECRHPVHTAKVRVRHLTITYLHSVETFIIPIT